MTGENESLSVFEQQSRPFRMCLQFLMRDTGAILSPPTGSQNSEKSVALCRPPDTASRNNSVWCCGGSELTPSKTSIGEKKNVL